MKARSSAVIGALCLVFAPFAQAQTAPAAGQPVPPRIASWTETIETGVWTTYDPGCFGPYFSCYSSQAAYNEGEIPKHPLPLKPQYAAEFKTIQDALKDGVSLFDPDALCHPAGMPYMMRGAFKIAFLPDRILFYYGGSLQYRTIFMDGRGHEALEPVLYTYNGESVGRWDGETLVIETRNIRGPDTSIGPHVPKSDHFWIVERYTPVSPDVMDLTLTMMDEERFERPFTQSYQIRRDAKAELGPQTACISGDGQRYAPDPLTGALNMTGPGGQPLELAD